MSMNVNFGLLRIISIISVIIFSAPIFAQTLSGVVQGKIDVKQVRVSTSSSPQLKKVSKRGYFSFRKVDLEKDTFFSSPALSATFSKSQRSLSGVSREETRSQ